MSIDSIRLGSPVHGIVTKTVLRTLPEDGGGWVSMGGRGGGSDIRTKLQSLKTNIAESLLKTVCLN